LAVGVRFADDYVGGAVPLIRATQILSGVLDGATVTTDAANRLVAACVVALPVTGVGFSLMTAAGPAGTVAVSDEVAAAMEDFQFTLGEGPGVDCSRRGGPVLQPDLAVTGSGRWPAFTAAALEVGIQAVFALPLAVGAIRLGVLDLYRVMPGQLSETELTTALSFADAAIEVLLHLQAQHHQLSSHATGPGTVPMMDDRAEVHQATGMLSVEATMPLADALVRLRAHAYATERPLLDLAFDVLTGVVKFENTGNDGWAG
jgi:hypothetical protein